MFRRGPIHFAVACALVAPSAAAAQEPPQLDPDSPAGVEYQLPLDQARRDASPDGGGGGGGEPRSGGGSGDPAPRFGAGITPDGSQSSDGAKAIADTDVAGDERVDGDESGGRADRDATGAGGGDAPGPVAGESPPSLGTASAESGGLSTGLTLGGIALAVVVVGGALGLALRRSLGSTTA